MSKKKKNPKVHQEIIGELMSVIEGPVAGIEARVNEEVDKLIETFKVRHPEKVERMISVSLQYDVWREEIQVVLEYEETEAQKETRLKREAAARKAAEKRRIKKEAEEKALLAKLKEKYDD